MTDKRLRAHANFERPAWADGQDTNNLLPALLAGRWNEKSEADRKILCHLADDSDFAVDAGAGLLRAWPIEWWGWRGEA